MDTCGPSADDVSLVQITHMKRRVCAGPDHVQRMSENSWIWFFVTNHMRVDHRIKKLAKANLAQELLNRTVGITNNRQLQSTIAERGQRFRHAGNNRGPERNPPSTSAAFCAGVNDTRPNISRM